MRGRPICIELVINGFLGRAGRGRTLPDRLQVTSYTREPTGSLARLSLASRRLKRGLLPKHSPKSAKRESPRLLFQTSFRNKRTSFGNAQVDYFEPKKRTSFRKGRTSFRNSSQNSPGWKRFLRPVKEGTGAYEAQNHMVRRASSS